MAHASVRHLLKSVDVQPEWIRHWERNCRKVRSAGMARCFGSNLLHLSFDDHIDQKHHLSSTMVSEMLSDKLLDSYCLVARL